MANIADLAVQDFAWMGKGLPIGKGFGGLDLPTDKLSALRQKGLSAFLNVKPPASSKLLLFVDHIDQDVSALSPFLRS
jgi:hypothetical protein